MSLGGGTYLEIIAPASGGPPSGDAADLARLATPRPVFFAVRTTDLDATARLLKAGGFAPSDPRPGSRTRPDGSVLRWRTMNVPGPDMKSAPFFIEWARDAPHPSETSPGGCTLAGLDVVDRDTTSLSKLFHAIGVDVAATAGNAPGLRVTLSCPRGRVILGP